MYLKFEDSYKKLEDILKLENNWNGNKAKRFSNDLINKCKKLLDNLDSEPFIAPCADGSVQFEWEKRNGQYLEFNIYENKIEMFRIYEKGKEVEEIINSENDLIKIVKEFIKKE